MRLEDIIRKPLITEKATLQRELANQYFVAVDRRANKYQIREAVEKLFKVTVTDVRTLTMPGKVKKVGRSSGLKPDWKKAVITLKAGDKIEFLSTAT